MLYLKKLHQLRNYLIYCHSVLLTYEISYICSLLEGIDAMISIEKPIMHYLNLLCLINELLNLINYYGEGRSLHGIYELCYQGIKKIIDNKCLEYVDRTLSC